MKYLIFILSLNLFLFSTLDAEIIDNMDTFNEWQINVEHSVIITHKPVKGKKDKAVEFNYTFISGKWILLSKNLNKNLTGKKALAFYFQGEGTVNNFEIKFEDNKGTIFGKLYEGITVTDGWSRVIVPLNEFNHWWGDNKEIDWQNIKILHFAITKLYGKSGKIRIDQIELLDEIPSQVTSFKIKYNTLKNESIDTMDDLSGWQLQVEGQAVIKLFLEKDGDRTAVKLNYDFKTDKWLLMQKIFNMDISKNSRLVFDYKASGEKNILQIKVEDEYNTVFGIDFRDVLPSTGKEWKTLEIPFDDLRYLWGKQNSIDFAKIHKIFIAVPIINGGAGSISIDNLCVK